MDILILLLLGGIFGWWTIWVALRAEKRRDAAKKHD